jgi:transposase
LKALEGGVHVNDTVIAIDIAKAVFELAVSRQPGRVDERKRLNRSQLNVYLSTIPPAVVVMEACGSAHSWARQAQRCGHVAVLIPPHLVRAYVSRNKTDRTDARAILEAFRNKDICHVPVKTPQQQMIGAQHRVRSGWVKERTAKLNLLRGLCREIGIVIPKGSNQVIPAVRALIGDDETDLIRSFRAVLSAVCDEIKDIETRLNGVNQELEALADQLPAVAAWLTIPGVGPVTATALYAFVGDLRRFPTARHFASFVGLTPRESSSGTRRHLGRISKRGDVYLRTNFIHGARSAIGAAKRSKTTPDRLRAWALELEKRVGHNTAAVALANKIARIAWVVSVRNDTYKSTPPTVVTSLP